MSEQEHSGAQPQVAQSSSNQPNPKSLQQEQTRPLQQQQSLQQSQQQVLQQVLQEQVQQHQTLQDHIQAVQQQHIQAALRQASQQTTSLQDLVEQGQQEARRMPRARADCKPRGRMTAYAYFVQTCREEHKKKHPDENVIFAEFSKKCAERWSTMVDKEKQRFHEMAEKDKKRYDLEMQSYVPPRGEKIGRGRKRKQMKDPNAPKRSLSAFFWFCNDERGKVKAANPEYAMGDIAKELGRRWAACDLTTKSKYDRLSEQDKARYEAEMMAYKKTSGWGCAPGQLLAAQPTTLHALDDDRYESYE